MMENLFWLWRHVGLVEPSTNARMQAALARPLAGEKQIVPPRVRIETELTAAERSRHRDEIERQ